MHYLSFHFCYLFFFFNDTATTEIYTLSLHDALPISGAVRRGECPFRLLLSDHRGCLFGGEGEPAESGDRKSTRLNSSHSQISYAVFCLKKKKKLHATHHLTYDIVKYGTHMTLRTSHA